MTTPTPTYASRPSLAPPSSSTPYRARSKSLSQARSPLLPTAPGNPYDHLPLTPTSSVYGHRRGASAHHLPSLTHDDADELDLGPVRAKVSDELSEDLDLEELATTGSISLDGGYQGPFQALDRHEKLAIVISFAGVGLLALAAGLTTIYDWVL